jgi:hypothetical protein
MNEGLIMLQTMVGAQLAKEPLPTPERIRELIHDVRQLPMFDAVTDVMAEKLAIEFETQHGVSMNIGSVLKGQNYEPWLDSARAKIDPYYWSRYKKLLTEKTFSSQVLATLDGVTDRILGLLESPAKLGKWDRRGMVVGHVQSGKTANYTGLICKAADAGYKLIVVIAGIHNNLRNQTQLRIDEGFVGRDSASLLSNRDDPAQKYIGVGRYDKSRRPVTFTNSLKDFNKTMATGVGVPLQDLKEPVVFVIKKNSSTLKNLIEWLTEHNAKIGGQSIDAPMLLIDDEADNASINTKNNGNDVSKINGQIRELLNVFDRSCYIGYTATPFANIFIDPKSFDEMRGADLFPRDFIVSLDPPTNYFGAGRVFIDNAESVIRHIEDNESTLPLGHRKDFQVTSLPASLCTAIRVFLVARAIRLVRGQLNKHSSMLVNVSRFTGVQRQLRNEIHAFVETIAASIRVNGALPPAQAKRDPEIAALHAAWLSEYAASHQEWTTIQAMLLESVTAVRVVEVNSNSAGALNYAAYEKTGLNVIAVGGFSLSRGLTLEGLTVSYFLRNSMMYDTLMQMGRWFGYRPGYEELCRVWMPEEAEGWYAHIAESIEELRDELRQMEATNATPEQFGLKVRSHPATLIVTARNKMGTGERLVVSIGLANKFVETAILKRDPASLASNKRVAVQFVQHLQSKGFPLSGAEATPTGHLLRKIPVDLISSFISDFTNHPGSMLTSTEPVRQYIEDRAATELAIWDVLFASLKECDALGLTDTSLGVKINCQRRSPGERSDAKSTLYITNKQRVASRGTEKTGLTAQQIADVELEYRQKIEPTGRHGGKSINYPDRIYRAVPDRRPLLVIHLLAIGKKEADLRNEQSIVAWSLSFPSTQMAEKKVEYVVNTTWLTENYGQDVEEEEMAGDDQ